jgi:hypothetical protein
VSRILVEVWTVKAILMRSKIEIRNLLLGPGGKVALVIKGQ